MAVQIVNKNLRDERAWGGGGNFPDEDVLCTFTGVSFRHHVGKVSKQPSLMLTLAIASYVDPESGEEPGYTFEKDYNISIPSADDKQAGKWKSLFLNSPELREALVDAESGEEYNWCMVFDSETCEVGYQLLDADGAPWGDYVLVGPGQFTGYLYWFAAGPPIPVPGKVLPDGTVQPAGVIRQFGDMMMLTDEQAEDIRAGTFKPSRPGGAKAKKAGDAAAGAGSNEVGQPAAPAQPAEPPKPAGPPPGPAKGVAPPGPTRAAPAAAAASQPPPGPSRAAPAAAPPARQGPPSGPPGRQPPRK